MKENTKEKLIAELPETQHGQVSYYHYAKSQIRTAKDLIEKLDFICGYLKDTWGEQVIRTNRPDKDSGYDKAT